MSVREVYLFNDSPIPDIINSQFTLEELFLYIDTLRSESAKFVCKGEIYEVKKLRKKRQLRSIEKELEELLTVIIEVIRYNDRLYIKSNGQDLFDTPDTNVAYVKFMDKNVLKAMKDLIGKL